MPTLGNCDREPRRTALLIRQQARDIDELWDRLSRAYLAIRREIPSDELRREIEEVRAHLERQRTIV